MTGLAPKISAVILDIGTRNIYLSLIIPSILPLVLGTALPVVPTYLLSMSILTPALLKLGVDEVAAHLFYIYWGVLGAVTPPTCEAAVVAAGIAKGSLLLRRKPVAAFAEPELDIESVEARMAEYLRHVPQAAKPMGIRVEDGTANQDDIKRTAKDRLFIRIEPR